MEDKRGFRFALLVAGVAALPVSFFAGWVAGVVTFVEIVFVFFILCRVGLMLRDNHGETETWR